MPKLHLGTIGWSYSFWRCNFYPGEIASKDFLGYYSRHFGTVEVDSTFYRFPTEQVIRNWRVQSSDGFLFSFKFPRLITHVRRLRGCERETDVFLGRAALLGDKLGVLLLQFPPSYAVKHMRDLGDYLQRLPKQHRYVVEVRNKSWLNHEFYSLLRDNHVALAWADSAPMVEVSEVTADFLYVRWEGDRKKVKGTLGRTEVDKASDLALWAVKMKPYVGRKMDVFGYFGKYFSGYPPLDVKSLLLLFS